MKPAVRLVALLIICHLPILSYSQTKKVKTQKSSSWVTPVPINHEAMPPEGENDSFYYLMIDEQENTATEEIYYHYAYKLLTPEGIQEMSDLNFDFDPQYQDLTVHEVKLIRGQQVINQIPSEIRTIQREQSSDRYLYDGSLTAIINMKDVRKGDIVEYSFTRKGYNPAFDGTLSRTLSFDYGVPSEKIFYRYLVPSEKNKNIRLHFSNNKEVPYSKETKNNIVMYTWDLNKVKKHQDESGSPGWYDGGSDVMITDFKSWEQVIRSTARLFQLSPRELASIKTEASKIFKSTDAEKYALEIIRFVQDEVRYLGFETGLNSYKPHSPVKVLENRFGDCKDKSQLLVAFLAARNIEAYPVLVHTTLKNAVGGRLPSNRLFNHCVVQVKMPDKTLYIDPTISSQGGDLFNYYFPDYRTGLVINDNEKDLTSFGEQVPSSTTEEQTFEVASIGGEAMFSIKTTYTGRDADYQRSEFSSTALTTVQENYQKYYARLYPDIMKWDDIQMTDDREKNILIVTEKYKIPAFWKPYTREEGAEADNMIYCVVEPQTLATYFDVSQSDLQRKDPLYLDYPVNYRHITRVIMPERFDIEEKELTFESDYYKYRYDLKSAGTEITREIHYQTRDNHIPVDHVKKYLSDHKAMNNNYSYMFTYNKSVTEASSGYVGVLVTLIALSFGGWLTIRLYRWYDPKPYFADEGTQIGGWLILVAIGVTISPFMLLATLAQDADFYAKGSYQGFFALKQYGYYFLSVFTHIFNLVDTMFAVLLAVLFYQRRSSFPRLYCIFLIANAIVITVTNVTWQGANDTFEPDYREVTRSILAALIWVPYFNMSSRVRETFVTRSDYYNPELERVEEERKAEEVERK
jgi:transglutaminase-like putative cysteine protease